MSRASARADGTKDSGGGPQCILHDNDDDDDSGGVDFCTAGTRNPDISLRVHFA